MAARDLEDGESCEMKGSGAKPYTLKNTGGVYSCSCPAWRNQSIPIESRTCKHLRKLRGDDAEKSRVGTPLPARKKSAAKKDAPPLLLAHAWDSAMELDGWWMSEKLDGVRAYWTGETFLSRLGNRYHAPDWFTEGLPPTPLDGELWLDRGAFQRAVSIVRRQDRSEHWREMKFVVFDAPDLPGAFEDRYASLRDVQSSYTSVLDQERCEGEAHLRRRLAEIEALGGEGLMLREPASHYEVGRSTTLLKVKSFHDAEAVVVGHSRGKGKHKGRAGALRVQLADGTEFSVGTGLSDADRREPPAVGSTITFRYQELTEAGVPRFPSFLRVAEEPPQADVSASIPESPSAGRAPAGRKTATKKAPANASPGPTTTVTGDAIYFELKDDKSAKFWEIDRAGVEVTVRYGRIGASGRTSVKSFSDESKAEAHAAKLIEQKTAKGYGVAERSPGQHE